MKTLLLFSVWVLLFVGIVGCVSRSIPANVTTQPAAQSSPASKPPTAVFLGDSITALWSQEGFGLSEWSQHPEWNNKGIIGQTSGQISARFDSDVVALHPDIVIICVGVNNVFPGFTWVQVRSRSSLATTATHRPMSNRWWLSLKRPASR